MHQKKNSPEILTVMNKLFPDCPVTLKDCFTIYCFSFSIIFNIIAPSKIDPEKDVVLKVNIFYKYFF